MPYKDKDKQKEANKSAAQRRRDKAKGMTGITHKGMTIPERHTQNVTPEQGVTLKPIPFAEPKRKRGEDIKTFHDLPPDVQRDIESMSQHAQGDKAEDKKARTARAIRYQHMFPNRYHSTGLN